MRRWSRLFTSLQLASALAAGCSASGPAQTQPAVSPSATVVSTPQAHDAAYYISAHGANGRKPEITNIDVATGRRVYTLRASTLRYSSDRKRGIVSDNTLRFFKGSAVRLLVTAPTANLDLSTYDVVLRGGVKATNSNGDAMLADTMSYNDKTRMLSATGHVRVTDRDGNTITGDRALADLDLQQLQMFGNINVTGFGK